MVNMMEPKIWQRIDSFGLVLGFVLCHFGFLTMNWELLINHSAYNPPLPEWYLGVIVFSSGIISFIILENGKKFKQTQNRINIKIVFLTTIILMTFFSLIYYPPNFII